MAMKVCPRCDAGFAGQITTCPIDGATLNEPSDPYIGMLLAGRYLVQELLGSGGMGSVYRARHQVIGRDVAIKFLDPSLTRNERQRKRFLGEARAANQIDHEHIIDINDYGETEDGHVYMVMEYLEGKTLSEYIRKGPLPVHRALRIALQVAQGLARAHELGVVHRDVKPANIYLTNRRDQSDFVKLLDFGVARIEQDARITGQNMIVGTPEYISPEQIRSSTAAPSSDLYALGCVLFEMLTGQLPFEGKTTVLLVKHLNDAPQPPSWVVPAIPPAVDNLVLKLLQKKPEDRYRDGYHLAEDLVKLIDELPEDGQIASHLVSSLPRGKRKDISGHYEEEAWDRTAKLYRDLLAQAHPKGDGPHWLPVAIERISAVVEDVRALREQLKAAVEKRTEQEEEARRPKVQIGHALDELAKDDSRIAREIESLQEELRPAESNMHDAIHVATTSIGAAPTDLKTGDQVSREQSAMLEELTHVAQTLANAREVVASLRSKLEAKISERKDLRFQMRQLKDKLEAMHAVSTCDMEVAHEEVNRIDSQITSKLAAIKPHAAKISEHFNQFPELREQLAKRHSGRPRPLNLN